MKNMAQKGYTTATDFADFLSMKKIYLSEKATIFHQNWLIMLKKENKIGSTFKK